MKANTTTTQYLLLVLLLLGLISGCARKVSPPIVATVPSPSPTQTPFPKQNGLINDFANVLDAGATSRIQPVLDSLLRDLEVEFAVVTVDSTGGQSAYDYSLALAHEWNRGKSGKGVLYLVSIKDRQWRIQVSTALQRQLPDEVCGQLHESVTPLFKEGKYDEGIESYVRAIDKRLRAKK